MARIHSTLFSRLVCHLPKHALYRLQCDLRDGTPIELLTRFNVCVGAYGLDPLY